MARLIDADKLLKDIQDYRIRHYNDEVSAFTSYDYERMIKDQPTVNTWIKCEDKLPENEQEVLYITENFIYARNKITVRTGKFSSVSKTFDIHEMSGVLAWMPIPEYKEE